MSFKLARTEGVIRATLQKTENDEPIKIVKLEFETSSLRKIEDILANKANAENQRLNIKNLELTTENYKRLEDAGYTVRFMAKYVVCGDVKNFAEVTMENMSFKFDKRRMSASNGVITMWGIEVIALAYGKRTARLFED